MRNAPRTVIAVMVIGLLSSCAGLHKPIQLTPAGEGVQLVEGGVVPADCDELAPVEARRGVVQQESVLNIKARNQVAELGGNLYEVTRRMPLRLEGKAFKCPGGALAGSPGDPGQELAPASQPSPLAPVAAAPPPDEPLGLPPAAPEGGAPATAGGETPDEQARALFERGRAAFDAARYEEALKYFRAAHQLSGRPELLYNVGQAADRLRRDAEALEAFEQFLTQAPPGDRRKEVEVRVEVLRRVVQREP